MSQSALFQPIRVRDLNLRNRIVIAPMCQYSAEDGCMTDWHLMHLGHLALSGAALLTIEATAVEPEGRITYADVGLYNDDTEAAIRRTIDSIRGWSDIPIAIQLAHAGRQVRRRKFRGKAERSYRPITRSAGKPFRPPRFPSRQTKPLPLPWTAMACVESGTHSSRRRCARRGSASMLYSYTVRTGTSCISFFRRSPISERTNTAGRSRTGCASLLRCLTPCEQRSPPPSPFRCGCRLRTG